MKQACAATRELARPRKLAAVAVMALPDFGELYDKYADFVWRNARRLGVGEAALDDVMQDVFLVAHRRLREVSSPAALRSWMLSIVIRVVRDHRRSLRRKDPHHRSTAPVTEPDELADTRMGNPLASVEQSDAVRLLHSVLHELDDTKREVLVLSELEELTEAEIAEILDEGVNTVHSRLRAAKKAFEQALARHRTRDEWRLR